MAASSDAEDVQPCHDFLLFALSLHVRGLLSEQT